MLKTVTLERFKCWHNPQHFVLSPLTIFFGNNGTGKSTLGHFLTLLKQTVSTSDESVVLYTGDPDSSLQLGTYSSLVYNYNRSKGLKFSYTIELPKYLEVVDTVDYTAEGKPSQYKIGDSLQFKCAIDFNEANHPFVRQMSYHLLDETIETMSISSTYSTNIVNTRGPKETSVVQYVIETTGFQLKSKTGRPWLQHPPRHFYGFSEDLDTYYKNIHCTHEITQAHENMLHNIYYVGTCRADLQRLHVWSGIRRFDVGKNGLHTITTLLGAQHRNISLGQHKRNQRFVKTIEHVLQKLGLLQAFHIETIDSIEHGFEIRIQSHNKANLELNEAGQSLIQILPVVVQCFSAPPNSIIVLDAPETHLHPTTQSLLAEVLIDVIQSREDGRDRNIQLIVSSQSEHLLKGLQHRILAGYAPVDSIRAYHTSMGRKHAHVEPVELISDCQPADLSVYFTQKGVSKNLNKVYTSAKRTLERPDAERWNIKVKKTPTRKRGRPKGSKNKAKK